MSKLSAKMPKGKPQARNTARSMSPSYHESLSVRQIDNGYIVCRSGPKSYTETYSATKPVIEVPKAKK